MNRLPLVVLLCVVGCSRQSMPLELLRLGPPAPKLTEQQQVDLLNREAQRRGLSWHIFCASGEGKPDKFQGTAWASVDGDVETTDRWMKTAPTQGGAAYALYRSIQGKPTHPAEKPKVSTPVMPDMCPPEITSDDPVIHSTP
jgi:hypothetical protein